MRDHYDFSNARPNPYVKHLPKPAITIRIDQQTLSYFKELGSELGIKYQTLINMYLRDCAVRKLRPRVNWMPRPRSKK